MRLTTEQRLVALERDNVVLHDTVKLLHKLLREQRQLINDYITRHVVSAGEHKEESGNLRPEDALYTFTCKRRFEQLEKRMEKIRKLADAPKSADTHKIGLKAG